MLKIAVLISGRGSNLQAIINQWQKKKLSVDLALVISNQENAAGLDYAKEAGIPTLIIPHKNYQNRESFDQALHQELKQAQIELIVLAGFMRILSPWFVKQWPQKIINIHPSLLPAFPGLNTHQRALEAGVKFSGCTVFFVDEGLDTGKIIHQAVVKIYDHDTEEKLAARILEQEHLILPEAIQMIASQNLK